VNLSLGEYRALVAKAFRGAGYSWGLTEEAAQAAKRLAEYSLPSGDVVVRLLTAVQGTPTADLMPATSWQSSTNALCPVCVGCSIVDQGELELANPGKIIVRSMHEPLLLAPFLAATLSSKPSSSYLVEWLSGSYLVSESGLLVQDTGHGLQASELSDVAISVSNQQPAEAPTASRIELEPPTMAALEQFAHRTYAPATEASRAKGAG